MMGTQLASSQLVPHATVSPSVVAQTTVSPSVVPHTTVSPSVVPHTTVSPSVVPQTTVSPSAVPQTTVSPTVVMNTSMIHGPSQLLLPHLDPQTTLRKPGSMVHAVGPSSHATLPQLKPNWIG